MCVCVLKTSFKLFSVLIFNMLSIYTGYLDVAWMEQMTGRTHVDKALWHPQ